MTNDQPIYAKLDSIMESKTAIRDAIIAKGVEIPEGTTFREYADLISGISTGLSDDALALADATPEDVTAGKTFYAGDRTLKTGTSQGGGVLKNIAFTLNIPLRKMRWAYMYWTVQNGESTAVVDINNPVGFSAGLVQYGVPIIVMVNAAGSSIDVLVGQSKVNSMLASGGIYVFAIFPEDGDSAEFYAM